MRALIALALLLAAAGCVTPPEDLEAAALEGAGDDAVGTTIDVSFDGSLGVGASACAPMQCVGQYPSDDSSTPVEFTGVLVGTTLTMTWDAASPATEEMYLGISWWTEEDDGGYEYVTGTSPLVLDLTDLDISDDNSVYIWAWHTTAAPMGIVDVSTPQSFLIEGTVATQPAAADEMADAE